MRAAGIAAIVPMVAWLTTCARAPSRLLDIRVARFQLHGTSGAVGHLQGDPAGLPIAASNLGHHANVRICIEELPAGRGLKVVPVDIDAANQTVGEILSAMVRQDPRYEYREKLGVIEVLPVGADENPADCLNMRVPILHVGYPWKSAFTAVRCQIEILSRDPHDIVFDPLRAGRCSEGGLQLRFPPPTTLRQTFLGRRVRDILDELCSRAGNVAWFAAYKAAPPTCGNLQLSETQPKAWYPADPDDSHNPNFMEGLPPKCTSCHYHSPQ